MKFSALKSKKEVEEYFSFHNIQCLICGKWYLALSSHLIRTHETDPDDYRDSFNLPWSRGLVGRETAQKQRDALQGRVDRGDKSILKAQEEIRLNAYKTHETSRTKRDYDVERFLDDGRAANNRKAEANEKKVGTLLKEMRSLNLSRGKIEGSGKIPIKSPTCTLKGAIKRNPLLNKEYLDVKKNASKKSIGWKLKTDRETLFKKIIALRAIGSSTKEIANQLSIGRTTVKRALRYDGAWKNFSAN